MDFKLVVVQFARNCLFDLDDSADKVDILEKVQEYAEETVPNFTDKQFQMNFRLSSTTFEDLLIKTDAVNNDNLHIGFPKTALVKELMITVWYLANMESMR